VSDEDAVKAGIADIVKEFGRLDTATANAGISIPRKSLFDISLADFKQIEAINLHGVLFTLREAARHMVGRFEAGDPGGSLVGIASTAAIHGAARNEHYAATKGAVVAMCRAMAVELGRYRITVNTICPGWIRSEMTERSQQWDKFNEKVISRVPVGGWGDGEDFAAIAVYLATGASRYHTGDSIVIDGGYTIY
jgi:NAD(P)-dependent dehydrogenase (short-subunit alcohol dehydrogenase family)